MKVPIVAQTGRCPKCGYTPWFVCGGGMWFIQHPVVEHCEDSGAVWEIPTVQLEKVATVKRVGEVMWP